MSRTLLLALLLGVAPPAYGQAVCRIGSVGTLSFGAYDQLTPAPTDTLTNIGITCDRDGGSQHITVEVALSAGVNGTSVFARRLVGGTGGYHLNYGLYSDAGRSAVWGETSGVNTVTQPLSVPNKGSASLLFTVYGRIPGLQNPTAGFYTDNVQVTVTP